MTTPSRKSSNQALIPVSTDASRMLRQGTTPMVPVRSAVATAATAAGVPPVLVADALIKIGCEVVRTLGSIMVEHRRLRVELEQIRVERTRVEAMEREQERQLRERMARLKAAAYALARSLADNREHSRDGKKRMDECMRVALADDTPPEVRQVALDIFRLLLEKGQTSDQEQRILVGQFIEGCLGMKPTLLENPGESGNISDSAR